VTITINETKFKLNQFTELATQFICAEKKTTDRGTDEDRERALNTYLAELNSVITNANRNEHGSNTLPSRSSIPPVVTQRKKHADDNNLINHLSRASNEEEEDEPMSGRKRAKEDMP
jgi:hypothetical protein